MTFRDDIRVLLTGVVLSLLSVIREVRRYLSGTRRPFVTLYMSPDSATLRREDDGPECTLADLVVDKVSALWPGAKFNSPWWLPGGDAHTMYSSIADFSKVDPIVYERKLLELPDKGIVAVDITPPLQSHPIAPGENVLFVTHGLTGGSHEAYVRAMLARATLDRQAGGLGFRAVVLNFRGCNGSPVVTPKLYHAGSSDDVRNVILWICHTFPECEIYGCGFSLGANILTKYAGEEGADCPLQGLVVIANPWNFTAGAAFLPSTILGRFVYWYVLGGALRALLRLHRRVFLDAATATATAPGKPRLPVSRATLEYVLGKRRIHLKEYDMRVQAPLYGFADAWDYYRKISSCKVMPDIRVPCLAINSVDDPITGKDSLPLSEVSQSPYVVLAVTQGGGHLGWYERTEDGRMRRWYVKPAEQFLGALVEYGGERRRKPGIVLRGDGGVRQEGREDVGFRELSREQCELVVSGTETSKLFTGW